MKMYIPEKSLTFQNNLEYGKHLGKNVTDFQCRCLHKGILALSPLPTTSHFGPPQAQGVKLFTEH